MAVTADAADRSYSVDARTRSYTASAEARSYTPTDRGRTAPDTVVYLRDDTDGTLALSLTGPGDAWLYEDTDDSLSLTTDASGATTATLVATNGVVEVTD